MASEFRLQASKLLQWRKDRRLWLTSVSPVGRTPFPTPHTEGPEQSVQMITKLWASESPPISHWSSLIEILHITAPDDCDWNGHMSNSSYAKNLDVLRMRVRPEWFPAFYADGGWIGLAGELGDRAVLCNGALIT